MKKQSSRVRDMEVILGITNECGITCCGILKKKLRHDELIDALGKKPENQYSWLFLKGGS